MTKPFTAAWLSAALVAATAVPLAAVPLATVLLAAGTPAGAAPGETQGTTPLDRKRNDAAKLAGMVRFVDAACPQARPDYDRFKRVIAGLGVDIRDLEDGELMTRSLSYTQAYRKDGAASCERALALFGESGTAIPGLVLRKAP